RKAWLGDEEPSRGLEPRRLRTVLGLWIGVERKIMIANTERGLTCEAVAWTHQGSRLSHDEQHAFRYGVRERGTLIGFITADRARQHPSGARWKRSLK